VRCDWEKLPDQGFEPFDAVLCVGNSLAHAPGQRGRQTALAAMAAVLVERGLLILTSRNWEKVRQQGSGLQVADRITERQGQRAVVIQGGRPDDWQPEQPHYLDIAVAVLDRPSTVTAMVERLTLWRFTHQTLEQGLRAAGLTQDTSTYSAHVDRYLVTARKAATATPSAP
jgi:hypothetical protein